MVNEYFEWRADFPLVLYFTHQNLKVQCNLDDSMCKLTCFSLFHFLKAHSRSSQRTHKSIEVKKTSPVSINNYKIAVATSDIYSQIDKDINSDSNINYTVVHNILKCN